MKPQVDENWNACFQTLEVNGERVKSVAWSGDSKRLASSLDDNTIRLWDPLTGACVQSLDGHADIVTSVAFSPVNSLQLASTSISGEVKIWDVSDGTCLQTFPPPFERDEKAVQIRMSDIVNTPNGRCLVVGHRQTVAIWDLETMSLIRTLTGVEHNVLCVAFSPINQLMAIGDYRGRGCQLWDISTGAYLRTLGNVRRGRGAVVFSGHGKWLAEGSRDGTVRVWDIESSNCLHQLQADGNVRSITFSANDQWLAAASAGLKVRVWDMVSGFEVQTLRGHLQQVNSVVFSHPDSQQLATASDDGTVKIWHMNANAQPSISLEEEEGPISSIAFSRDGKRLATTAWYDTRRKTLRVWDTSTCVCLQTMVSEFAAFSNDGQWLAVAKEDDGASLEIWSTADMTYQQTMDHGKTICCLAFSTDDQRLASGAEDGSIKVWSLSQGRCLQSLDHGQDIGFLAFSHDSQHLASTSKGLVKVWGLECGECLKHFEASTRYFGVTWSLDDQWLAVNLRYRVSLLAIQDTQNNPTAKILDCKEVVLSAAFTADSKWIAVSTESPYQLQLWDVGKGEQLWCYEVWNKLTDLSPDFAYNARLCTNIGTIELDGGEVHRTGYGISFDGQWILRDEEQMLKLPAEYRTRWSDVAGSTTIAIGIDRARVVMMGFR